VSGAGPGSSVRRARATNSVPSPVGPVTPTTCSEPERPCRGTSSARVPSPGAQPVTRTGVPGAAPATTKAHTSAGPDATTGLTTRAADPAVCRVAAQPSPTPSGTVSVRLGSPPPIRLLSYAGDGRVAVEEARRVQWGSWRASSLPGLWSRPVRRSASTGAASGVR
jgi:hypothetical protein